MALRLRPPVTATVLLVAAAACAGNTLAQDLAWERWQRCNTIPAVQLKEIRPDGQIWIWYTDPSGLAAWQACEREARKVQAASSPPTTTATLAVSAPTVDSGLPMWRVGDEWAYRYDGPTGSGTYVWSVASQETVDGIVTYVLTTGARKMFYRTSDLAFVKETIEGAEVSRTRPPRTSFVWPLIVGREWEQAYVEERARDRTTQSRVRQWKVDVDELVAVPAGTFQTFKITMREKGTGAIVYEMWWAPAVKQFVKIRERLETGLRERELIAFKVR